MRTYSEFFGGSYDAVFSVIPTNGDVRRTTSIKQAVRWAREEFEASIWIEASQNLNVEMDIPRGDFYGGSLTRKYDESPVRIAADHMWENDLLDD